MSTDRKDIALTEEYDLKIENGDFVIESSDQQHVQRIFKCHPGENKEFLLIGFGATKYLKKPMTKQQFLRNLKEQLKYDGYTNPEIDTTNGLEQLIIKV